MITKQWATITNTDFTEDSGERYKGVIMYPMTFPHAALAVAIESFSTWRKFAAISNEQLYASSVTVYICFISDTGAPVSQKGTIKGVILGY